MEGIPVGHPLEGCFEKYRRAEEHFNLLQEEISDRYPEGQNHLVTIAGELDPDNDRQYRHVVIDVDRAPVRWATIVGDIVHNLRSILDHLVFELAFIDNGGVPPERHVAFPTSKTRNDWKSVQKTMLAGVSSKHRAMLYRLQPCYGRHDSASAKAIARRKPHAFADLTDIWNDDKHRTVRAVLVAPMQIDYYLIGTTDCVITGKLRFNRTIYGRPFEKGAVLVSTPIRGTGPNPQVEMKFDISAQVGLRDGVPIRDRLAGMAQWVREVLIWFEPEFRTPKARALWGLDRGGRIQPAPVMHPRRTFLREFTGPLPTT